MLEHTAQQFALQILAGMGRQDLSDELRHQLMIAFWETIYLQRLGVLQVLPHHFPPPIPPGPSPSGSMASSPPPAFLPVPAAPFPPDLLTEVIDSCTGEKFSAEGLLNQLQDRTFRLTAARNLAQRLHQAEEQINQEIAQLEQL